MRLTADVLIVGAGLLGSSVAMHLAKSNRGLKIMVLDLDLDGVFSSSELNAGGVRATWNHPVNAAVSKLSLDYYETIASEIGFRQYGYFWMYPKESWESARKLLENNPNLKDLQIEYLTPSDVTSRYAFLDKTSDLGGATFSPKDGLLNANLLKGHYRKQAKDLGVEFLNRIWIDQVLINSDETITLEGYQFAENLSMEELKKILTLEQKIDAPRIAFSSKMLVNCSGAWARRFAKCMGTDCKSTPIRRQVSVFECKGLDLTPYGMFVDSSGVYFHAEAHMILGGYATPEEPSGYNFEYDGVQFFESHIWPPLYERSTLFENLKHITGWAGLYEVSPDKSGIVGRVPGFKNVYEAHSFSGRGAMQSYGVGQGLSELMNAQKFLTIDLSSLSGERFLTGKTVSEGMLI